MTEIFTKKWIGRCLFLLRPIAARIPSGGSGGMSLGLSGAGPFARRPPLWAGRCGSREQRRCRLCCRRGADLATLVTAVAGSSSDEATVVVASAAADAPNGAQAAGAARPARR